MSNNEKIIHLLMELNRISAQKPNDLQEFSEIFNRQTEIGQELMKELSTTKKKHRRFYLALIQSFQGVK